jgi:hypothetical protein
MCGLMTYIKCKSKKDWHPSDIVPYKEITSIVPSSVYK